MDIQADSSWSNPRKVAAIGAALVVLLVGAAWLFVAQGGYNVAADAPHTRAIYWLTTEVRSHSIKAHARDLVPPTNLTDPDRIATGAGLYSEMCSGCHLAPGMERTEISQGLYPAAPELSNGSALTPSEQFWVIKHGIKMTGMAAWGKTHDDVLIWDMVAFLRKLPALTPAQYQALVKSAPADHDEMMKMEGTDHDHQDMDNHEHNADHHRHE